MLSSALHASLCPTPPSDITVTDSAAGENTDVRANQINSVDGNIYRFEGDVRLIHRSHRVTADSVHYDNATSDLQASGNVNYSSDALSLSAPNIATNLESGSLQADEINYRVRLDENGRAHHLPPLGLGQASQLTRYSSGRIELENVDFTTCQEANPAWQLKAAEMTLDTPNAEGSARHVTLRWKDVPVLYLPWIGFPIGDVRKSGFLAPRFGTSDKHGTEIEVPWYWNIHPQADATLTPRYLSKRGVQLASQWRALTHSGRWWLDNEYLHDDRETDAHRYYTRLRHTGNPWQGWTSSIDANKVSDADYFDDFGDSYDLFSLTHLEQRADLTHRTRTAFHQHTLTLRLQQYQTIEDSIPGTSRPYQRKPQIRYDATLAARPGGFLFDLRTEAVKFDRNDSVTAERIDLRPRIRLPLNREWGFLRPSLTAWHTEYALANNAIGTPDTLERNLGVLSIDSGLIFEREISTGTQTLEPRLFYVYIPNEDQSDIPIFDSHRYDFTYSQLFRENRFSGADRVGDTRQLTVAVTSRLLDARGIEWASASVGQIHYFSDRNVTLNNTAAETHDRSDLITELRAHWGNHWNARGTLNWDYDNEQTSRGLSELRYRGSNSQVLSAAHRYRRDDYEQLTLSFSSAIDAHWRLSGRWNYALDDDHSIDSLLALEYQSCCWAFRTALRRQWDSDDDSTDNSIHVEFVMKGLGSAGDDVGQRLEHDILGYSDPFQ
ncbi:MAG: LPS-assembly protein LptD [Pseudomonadota bacterium]